VTIIAGGGTFKPLSGTFLTYFVRLGRTGISDSPARGFVVKKLLELS